MHTYAAERKTTAYTDILHHFAVKIGFAQICIHKNRIEIQNKEKNVQNSITWHK